MKFLADMGVSQRSVVALRELGHDIVHLREQGLQTLPDDEIMAKGSREGRVVITFDLDFGELLAAAGSQFPSVILVRMRISDPKIVTSRLLAALRSCDRELENGAIVTLEDSRLRIRNLPIEPVPGDSQEN